MRTATSSLTTACPGGRSSSAMRIPTLSAPSGKPLKTAPASAPQINTKCSWRNSSLNRFTSIEMVRFVNSGTEAVMSAIRLARGYHRQRQDNQVRRVLPRPRRPAARRGRLRACHLRNARFRRRYRRRSARTRSWSPFNDIDALAGMLEKEHATRSRPIIMEPVPCNYGLILPQAGLSSGVRALCDRYKILLIFDEVITGFRLAPGRRAGIFRRESGYHDAGENHRRRTSGRGLWRFPQNNGNSIAAGHGVPGRYAVRESPRHVRRHPDAEKTGQDKRL